MCQWGCSDVQGRTFTIDFLLLHPEAGLIVLEVKGGAIKVERGDWYTQPRGATDWKRLSRSPFKQSCGSKVCA